MDRRKDLIERVIATGTFLDLDLYSASNRSQVWTSGPHGAFGAHLATKSYKTRHNGARQQVNASLTVYKRAFGGGRQERSALRRLESGHFVELFENESVEIQWLGIQREQEQRAQTQEIAGWWRLKNKFGLGPRARRARRK